MVTPLNTFWALMTAYLPKGKWLDISEIYSTIENNIDSFTANDLKAVTLTNNEPTWHRNVRNVLQARRESNEILYAGNSRYQFPATSYYIIGSKYGEHNNVDMLPLMEEYNIICTGFAWDYDLTNFYQKPETEISDFLKRKKEEPKSYNAIRKFLQLKPGDVVAVKSDGSPKAGKPFLEIVAYAVVVERDGEVYWREQEHFGHCINVQFIKTGFKKQFDIGGYGRTIHCITDSEVIDTLFGNYKTATSTTVRQKISARRRTRSAATSKNLLGQRRKGSGGYVTNPVHNQIQQLFKEHLEKQFGKDNLQLEENNVDIKLFKQDTITFYEVKPYDYAEDCIRSGLGQLLSYVFFDTDKRKKKIRIVGPYPPNIDEQNLIAFLKRTLSIDFDYESFKVS